MIHDQKGFSLVELIIFIIIGAIFIPASLVAFTTVMDDLIVPDHHVKARFYAQQKMEQVTSQDFNNVTCTMGTPNVLTSTDSPEGDYSRTCTINYVQYNAGNNSIEDLGIQTEYKKVYISVTTSSRTYDVATIISRRPRS